MIRTVAILATMVFARIDSCGGVDPRSPEPPAAPAQAHGTPPSPAQDPAPPGEPGADAPARPVPPPIMLVGPEQTLWTDGLRDDGGGGAPADLPANPEPATIVLAGAGLAAAAWWRRRRRQS